MGFGAKLSQLLDEKGLTPSEFCRMADIPRSTLGSIIDRDYNKISIDVFLRICSILDCDPNYFADEINQPPETDTLTPEEKRRTAKIRALDAYGVKAVDSLIAVEGARCEAERIAATPTIRIKHSEFKVSAGLGFEFLSEEEWGEIDVPDTPAARKANFALTITGDSMEPIYFDGDIVLVKEQPQVERGEVGIFVLNGAGYIKKNGGDRLISLNEKYADIKLAEYDNCRCVGKVIGRCQSEK